MNPYFNSLKRLYDQGKITSEQVALAVEKKGWISEEEYRQITGFIYPAVA